MGGDNTGVPKRIVIIGAGMSGLLIAQGLKKVRYLQHCTGTAECLPYLRLHPRSPTLWLLLMPGKCRMASTSPSTKRKPI